MNSEKIAADQHPIDMKEFIGDQSFWLVVTIYIVAAAAGLAGSLTVASVQYTRRRQIRCRGAQVAAYCMLGIAIGFLTAAWAEIMNLEYNDTLHSLVIYSFVAGAVGATSLLATNVGVAIILRKLGIEVRLNVDKKPKDDE